MPTPSGGVGLAPTRGVLRGGKGVGENSKGVGESSRGVEVGSAGRGVALGNGVGLTFGVQVGMRVGVDTTVVAALVAGASVGCGKEEAPQARFSRIMNTSNRRKNPVCLLVIFSTPYFKTLD